VGIPFFCELYYQRCPISKTAAKPPAPAAWYGGACAYIVIYIILL
jgi:hypothetical protein